MFADSNDPRILSLREKIQSHRSERDGTFSIAECDKVVFEEIKEVVINAKVSARELASVLGLDLNHIYAIRSVVKMTVAKRVRPKKKSPVKFKQIVVREQPRTTQPAIRFIIGESEISVEVEDAETAARIMQFITKVAT